MNDSLNFSLHFFFFMCFFWPLCTCSPPRECIPSYTKSTLLLFIYCEQSSTNSIAATRSLPHLCSETVPSSCFFCPATEPLTSLSHAGRLCLHPFCARGSVWVVMSRGEVKLGYTWTPKEAVTFELNLTCGTTRDVSVFLSFMHFLFFSYCQAFRHTAYAYRVWFPH